MFLHGRQHETVLLTKKIATNSDLIQITESEGKERGRIKYIYTECLKIVVQQHFSMLQQPQLPRNLFLLLKSTMLIEFFQHAQDASKSLL